jgi:RNA polymerase sigma-70 factor (ECF subfamily)
MSTGGDIEAQCLEKLRRGGSARVDAISQLYRAYAPRFRGYFLKHRVAAEHADEMVQDVFVAIVRHCDDFRGDTRFDAWMWAIARNVLIDHFRRASPEQSVDEEVLDAIADPATVGQAAASEGLDDCVQRAYARFAESHADRAEMLAKVAFDEWSIEDVAAALKRTPGATREYLSQCRKKLKVFLQPCLEYLTG